MKAEIQKELSKLEIQKDIKILFAVECGSRAWGFASEDSDWDVRFVYIHKKEWYFKIDNLDDALEIKLPNDIDMSGWELKKTLRLYRKCNPSLLEWIKSPLVYVDNYGFKSNLDKLSKEFFNSKSYLYHYLHMAEGNYYDFLVKDMVKIKKYFYVLRPILVCEWILKYNTIAPVEFNLILASLEIDKSVKAEIDLIIDKKIKNYTLGLEPRNEILNNYLISKINFLKEYLKNKVEQTPNNTPILDKLFVETIEKVWP